MDKLIYLASPYSHKNNHIQHLRYEQVCYYAAELTRQGLLVFSPIAHSHGIAKYGLPTDWQFWQQYDEAMISRCDSLTVLMLDGWKESKGVQAEIEIAKRLGIPVEYMEAK